MKHIQVDTTENKDKQGLNKQNEIKTQEQMMNNEEQLKNKCFLSNSQNTKYETIKLSLSTLCCIVLCVLCLPPSPCSLFYSLSKGG